MTTLKAVWGEDMSEDLGGTPKRKPNTNVQVIVPVPVTSSCQCSVQHYKSAQDEEDELVDSWNGDPIGTNRKQREQGYR